MTTECNTQPPDFGTCAGSAWSVRLTVGNRARTAAGTVEVLVGAPVLGLALGYENLSDPDGLRQSKLWSLLCGTAARGTQLARVQCGAIRLKPLKLGIRIGLSVRAVRLSFDEGFPEADLLHQVLWCLQHLPRRC